MVTCDKEVLNCHSRYIVMGKTLGEQECNASMQEAFHDWLILQRMTGAIVG
jgi:hypothetical protein